MSFKKFFISLVIFVILALTFAACSGTKSICPAYSSVESNMPVESNS